MYMPLLLLSLPLFFAIIVLFAKKQKAYKLIMRLAAITVIATTIACVFFHYNNTYILSLLYHPVISYLVMIGIALYVFCRSIKSRFYLVSLFSVLQIGFVIWLKLFSGHVLIEHITIYIDKLTLIMIILVGLVGGLICLYSEGYMKKYHQHYLEQKDRQSEFFSAMLFSIFAMFGLIIFSDLIIMLLFLQIISVCSFYLVGYTKSHDSDKNAFSSLTFNMFGDFCFAFGIVILVVSDSPLNLNAIAKLDSISPLAMSAILLFACSGLAKAAQFPFSKWLLNATTIPTPVLALLHSTTMINAGIYLIIRLSPMLGQNAAGITVTFVGGLTFIITAALAGSQNDAKKMLAYSTVSILGLVVVCAGVSTPASLWAAIMLIILHSVAKALLFLSFASAEHQPGNRDVEHMRGMHGMSMRLAMFLIIGMAGMLIAPFVMLLSRWTAMQAFMNSGNLLIVMIIAFGSTITLFYWTKWIGKLIAHIHLYDKNLKYPERLEEKFSLFTLATFVLIVCILYPLVSEALVIPFIRNSMLVDYGYPITPDELSAIFLMLIMLLIIPIILIPYFKKHSANRAPTYLAGVNTGDDLSYRGAMGQVRRYELRNRYLFTFLNERRLLIIGYTVCLTIIILGFFVIMGGSVL